MTSKEAASCMKGRIFRRPCHRHCFCRGEHCSADSFPLVVFSPIEIQDFCRGTGGICCTSHPKQVWAKRNRQGTNAL